MRRLALQCIAAAAALLLAAPAFSQSGYPERPIRIVVPFPPGGTTDAVARVTAQKLAEVLGQPVFVDNRPGGNTSIGAGFVAKAAPDGYNLLFTGGSTHVIHTMQSSLPYDSMRDFTPVGTVSQAGYVIVVNNQVPARTLPEFIAHAKANPGRLNFASAGVGNPTHLGGELFNQAAGVKTVHVPYKGGAAALQDLIGGRVQFLVTSIPAIQNAVEAGQVRALAYTGQQPDLPPVPTFAQYGMPEFEKIQSLNVLLGPAGLPEPVLKRLSDALARVLPTAEMAAALKPLRDHPLYMSPAQTTARMRADYERYDQVIKAAGIQLNP